MATTTNFGWETPDDTDLVKDGAAAMRTLGNSIDTSFVDLKGGTTGQILSKASNTDLDYAWITNDVGDITAVTAGTGISGGGTSGAVTITNDMATTITASGDIVVGTGSGTYDNLPIGTTGQVLTADTTVSPYKVKWASASSSKTYTLVNTGGTALSGSASTNITGITGDDIFVLIVGASSASASSYAYLTFNGIITNKYATAGTYLAAQSTYGASQISNQSIGPDSTNSIVLAEMSTSATSTMSGYVQISGCKSSGLKPYLLAGAGSSGGGNSHTQYVIGGVFNDTNPITSVKIWSGVGNFDAGTIYVYQAG